MDDLKSMLIALAERRRAFKERKAALDRAMDEWREQHKAEIEALKELQEAIADLDNRVREEAVRLAKETGDRNPAPGVRIRVVRKLKYDTDAAIFYAATHGLTDALKLKKREFEAAVRDHPPAGVVEVEEELQATLASNLEEVVANTLASG